MIQNSDCRDVLVIRPWLGTVSGGDAYAHFDALAMSHTFGEACDKYGDLRVFVLGDDGRKTLRLDGFRFQCQTDERKAEAYGWQWGYQPGERSVFSFRDIQRYGPSITAIGRALDRMHREDGPPETVGRFVVRLARVLKLQGIVLIETSMAGSFHDAMAVRRMIAPDAYGEAIGAIDDLVRELHQACAGRVGKVAA